MFCRLSDVLYNEYCAHPCTKQAVSGAAVLASVVGLEISSTSCANTGASVANARNMMCGQRLSSVCVEVDCSREDIIKCQCEQFDQSLATIFGVFVYMRVLYVGICLMW